MIPLARLAFGAAALAAAPLAAEPEGRWEVLHQRGEWQTLTATGGADGRICAAATAAESGTRLSVEAAEGLVSIVLTDPNWSVEAPGGAVEGFRFAGAEGESFPLEAYAFGDTVVANASDDLLQHLAEARTTRVEGPEGPVAEFSLAGSAASLRALRDCAGL